MLVSPRFRSKVLGLALACSAAPAALEAQAAGSLVLDSASIAQSGARTLADLLAARVPGLGVTYLTGAPGMAAQVTARGSAGISPSRRSCASRSCSAPRPAWRWSLVRVAVQ